MERCVRISTGLHKGLQSVLFDLSVELAHSDFSNAGEASVAVSACRRAVAS
jgi:hypothetical protein